MYNLSLGASCGGEYYPVNRKLFETYAANGIWNIEISQYHRLLRDCNWQEIKKASQNSGVAVWSFHLPYAGFDIAVPDKRERSNTIKYQREYISVAAELGARYCVIHPGGGIFPEIGRSEELKIAKESLALLAEHAQREGTVIAVENLPRTCLGNTVQEMSDIISCDERLKVCFDVNHILQGTHREFMETLGKEIVTLHISDYDFVDERHWLPGKGKINWVELMDLLGKVEYSGCFMYEIDLRPEDEYSPDLIARTTYQELVQNYNKLMECPRCL